jgi:hypothetical protein
MRHLALLIAFVFVTSCKPYAPPGPLRPIVDCVNADRGKVVSLVDTLWPFGGPIDWHVVEQQAIDSGLQIGGCALAEFVQTYLTPKPGNALPVDSADARDTLEHFRATKAGNAVFKTAAGEL